LCSELQLLETFLNSMGQKNREPSEVLLIYLNQSSLWSGRAECSCRSKFSVHVVASTRTSQENAQGLPHAGLNSWPLGISTSLSGCNSGP
jgi:hypothetical protein